MVRVCAFPGCGTKMRRYNPETFHRLPLQESNLRQWLAVLQVDVETPVQTLKTKDYRICSRHFDPNDFSIPNKRRSCPAKRMRLKRNAIPIAARLAQETAPCEESCPGMTFEVSELNFDEESNCSNEEGGEAAEEEENICSNEEGEEEVERIDDADSDWELELSDKLESDDSDQLESDDHDQLESNDSELHRRVRQLCPDCGAFYFTSKTHTCEYKIKPVSCNVCGKRCVDKSALKAHSSIHKESYEHPCKFCMVPFKTRLYKLAHEKAHTHKAKPYECPDCSMSFSKLPARNLHLKGHRGPKILSCPHCALEFRYHGPLERHMLVHTGMKEYVCEFCHRSFKQPGHLKSHLRVHTGEKPFQCQHCDKSFNHNVSLKSHVMRYHKEGVSNFGPIGPVKQTKRAEFQSMGRPRGRPKRNAATREQNSVPAVRTTAAEMSVKGRLRRDSSKDIDGDWSDWDRSSELTEEDKMEEVRKSKRKSSHSSKTFSIAENDSESDSDSHPEEEAKKSKVVKSEKTGRCRGRPRTKPLNQH
ncbi:zinc finger protein 28-like isoform X1 [Gadus macrocephalus]|uniref:zinc finger protein 28-like isoform X1 n=1 Tax=Gadus macrocephalus TaxID=80720 RepID=UPI0028CB3D1D|nr:zinc finger protein 28-like isoform X1 [Gadus macrocephalus]